MFVVPQFHQSMLYQMKKPTAILFCPVINVWVQLENISHFHKINSASRSTFLLVRRGLIFHSDYNRCVTPVNMPATCYGHVLGMLTLDRWGQGLLNATWFTWEANTRKGFPYDAVWVPQQPERDLCSKQSCTQAIQFYNMYKLCQWNRFVFFSFFIFLFKYSLLVTGRGKGQCGAPKKTLLQVSFWYLNYSGGIQMLSRQSS